MHACSPHAARILIPKIAQVTSQYTYFIYKVNPGTGINWATTTKATTYPIKIKIRWIFPNITIFGIATPLWQLCLAQISAIFYVLHVKYNAKSATNSDNVTFSRKARTNWRDHIYHRILRHIFTRFPPLPRNSWRGGYPTICCGICTGYTLPRNLEPVCWKGYKSCPQKRHFETAATGDNQIGFMQIQVEGIYNFIFGQIPHFIRGFYIHKNLIVWTNLELSKNCSCVWRNR